MATKLFETAIFNESRSRKIVNREGLASTEMGEEFNTYMNFGIFPTYNDAFAPHYDGEGETTSKEAIKANENQLGSPGIRSLFNKYDAIMTGIKTKSDMHKDGLYSRDNDMHLVTGVTNYRVQNTPLVDTPSNRQVMKKTAGVSVKELVDASKKGAFGRGLLYDYSDFMYCKYLGRVPNNYLITLRRFPIPVLDTMKASGYGKQRKKGGLGRMDGTGAIGMMVTWLGVSGNEMKNILKYSYKMAFEEKKAGWEEVQTEGGDSGVLNGLEAMMNKNTAAQFKAGYNIPAMNFFTGMLGNGGSNGPYSPKPHIDKNKVYGPIDRVKKIYMRSEEGLDWDQNITLVFEYEMRAYYGVNPKQAFLDLISHILSVTYTTGGFWGGGYRGSGTSQSSTWRNLNIFKCNGTFTDYVNAFTKDLSSGFEKVKTQFNITDPASLGKALLNILNNVGGLLMGAMINKLGRPAKMRANSLLSDTPVGLWHVTIGNPHRPIMTMGNMILKNTTIEHSGPLGIDDFPTHLKVTCELTRGRPRDQVMTEQLYNNGNDRIFHSMDGKIFDMYKASIRFNSTEEEWKKEFGDMAVIVNQPGEAYLKREEERKEKEEAKKRSNEIKSKKEELDKAKKELEDLKKENKDENKDKIKEAEEKIKKLDKEIADLEKADAKAKQTVAKGKQDAKTGKTKTSSNSTGAAGGGSTGSQTPPSGDNKQGDNQGGNENQGGNSGDNSGGNNQGGDNTQGGDNSGNNSGGGNENQGGNSGENTNPENPDPNNPNQPDPNQSENPDPNNPGGGDNQDNQDNQGGNSGENTNPENPENPPQQVARIMPMAADIPMPLAEGDEENPVTPPGGEGGEGTENPGDNNGGDNSGDNNNGADGGGGEGTETPNPPMGPEELQELEDLEDLMYAFPNMPPLIPGVAPPGVPIELDIPSIDEVLPKQAPGGAGALGNEPSEASKDVKKNNMGGTSQENNAATKDAAKASQDEGESKKDIEDRLSFDTGMSFEQLEKVADHLKKYFGDPDVMSILYASQEQAYGAFDPDPKVEDPPQENKDADNKDAANKTEEEKKKEESQSEKNKSKDDKKKDKDGDKDKDKDKDKEKDTKKSSKKKSSSKKK